jgi:hypothetical protein
MSRRQGRSHSWRWFQRRSQVLIVSAAALLLAGLAVGSAVGGDYGDGTNLAFRCGGSGASSSPSSGPKGFTAVSGPIVVGGSGPTGSGPTGSGPVTSGSGCPVFGGSASSEPATATTTTTTTTTTSTTTTTTTATTAAAPPPPVNVFAAITQSQFGTLAANASGVITIPGTQFTCPSGDVRCIIRATGTALFPHFKLSVQAAKKKKSKRLSLGTTETSVPAGAQGRAKLKLGKKALKALKKSKKVKATFTIAVRNQAGAAIGTRTVTATIKAPKPKKKHKH